MVIAKFALLALTDCETLKVSHIHERVIIMQYAKRARPNDLALFNACLSCVN